GTWPASFCWHWRRCGISEPSSTRPLSTYNSMPRPSSGLSCKLFCTAAKDGGLNIASFRQVSMTFAIVSVLGIFLQVDGARGGPDKKADAMPTDPVTLATIKGAIALARKGEPAQATDVKESISNPLARKVVEWAILCSDNNEADFQRYVVFISDNPGWPNIGLLAFVANCQQRAVHHLVHNPRFRNRPGHRWLSRSPPGPPCPWRK